MYKKLFDKFNGKEIHIYTIRNEDIEVEISDLGARINAIRINGSDIALGFNSVEDYLKSGSYAGATIGRVANRIADGKFSLNGKIYSLNKNDGENHSHGGFEGYDKKFFSVTAATENSVTMHYLSADGEEKYPGNLNLTVTFTIANGSLSVKFSAESDKDTLWNPTTHVYFNLDGEDSGDCRNNLLQINADYYTPLGKTRVPTDEKKKVDKTPFNFNVQKQIGADFGKDELAPTNGYDHNYLLSGEHAAHAESAKTGIKMDLYTDLPCLQLYTGGMISGAVGKTRVYDKWAGFCLEPQFCPNAINMQGFEKPILKKNEPQTHFIKFMFTKT